MFAILLSEENLPKIHQTPNLSVRDAEQLMLLLPKEIYVIRNYRDRYGIEWGWSFFPASVFKDTFEYDPIKIQNDWDIVVRKS